MEEALPLRDPLAHLQPGMFDDGSVHRHHSGEGEVKLLGLTEFGPAG